MTILEAIDRVDTLEHNVVPQEQKVCWLAQVDALLREEVIRTHEGQKDVPVYDQQTPLETELLVQPPFDGLYLHFLRAMIHYCTGEYDRFNQAMGLFQADYTGFVNFYNRTHTPRGKQFRYC